MELTTNEQRTLIHRIGDYVVKKLREEKVLNESEDEYVSTKEAARILGVSEPYMRNIAVRFPHTKQGSHKQGKLRFLKKALFKSYLEA